MEVELVTTLKKGASILVAQVFEEGGRDEDNTLAMDVARATRLLARAISASGSSSTLENARSFILQLPRASTATIAILGEVSLFDPLRLFFEHLEVEFGAI